MTEHQTENSNPAASAVAGPTRASSLRLMVPALIALSGVAIFVYANRPKPAEYNPGPEEVVKAKTVAEVKKNIETVKASPNIPKGEKSRILGFLNMELEQAKARESGAPVPPMQANPPVPGPPPAAAPPGPR